MSFLKEIVQNFQKAFLIKNFEAIPEAISGVIPGRIARRTPEETP